MLLYAIRHGIAEDISSTGSDSDRKLTPQGIERTMSVAKGLRKLGLRFDRILSSPYTRALQTAEIIAEATDYNEMIHTDSRLVPSVRFEDAGALIAENSDVESLLITGHEPSMGYIISGICAQGQLLIEVKKASVTALQITRLRPVPMGYLLWSLPPKVMIELAQF